jgi:superfamily II DNA or RNA helicase
MSTTGLILQRHGIQWSSAVLHERDEWGLRVVDIVNPPRRVWADETAPCPMVEPGIDAMRLKSCPTPAQLLSALPESDSWPAQTRRSLARLQAWFLLAEDPQRRLDAREVETLAHQVSLVRHILETDRLSRVLIADEVGLGKTVEVGLLLKELLATKVGLRILYLAPARLVSNVRGEFDRLGLHFRQWSANDSDARLSDARIIASIHRAVHGDNTKKILGAPAWDIIVVDECHHLSAWEPGAGDPREAFKLVRDLIEAQPADGRVIFLSGTPHQGNTTRFENLIALLRRDGESEEALAGRVIYRTKDDVRDWNGDPLFPARKVNEPVVVDLGPRHRAWIARIHGYFQPPNESAGYGQARQRAAGWRCMQALQWAASSPIAGLGYLVRQALRAGWDLRQPSLPEALAALRPYRLGPPDEAVEHLFERMRRELVRQRDDQDVADIEDGADADGAIADERLRALLREGTDLVLKCGDEKWDVVYQQLLRPAGAEKVVLFAQPVETVTGLARYLTQVTGVAPAMIVGGQTDEDRRRQVEAFRRSDGPQFLVSSRAGGEGINLQVARRLVHVDVPWNPMDMEQRVGRVHRFGSRQTIIVDTLVVKDSREADAYRIAREKLQRVAKAMVEPERFEATFARVMCLVPPDALQSVLINQATAPFSDADQDRIAAMVQEGFQVWRQFHARFGEQQSAIREQDPGLAEWVDVSGFLASYAKAESVGGFTAQRFRYDRDGIRPIEEAASVIRLPDGQTYAIGDYGGLPVTNQDRASARPLGLNCKPVAEVLRRTVFPEMPSGAAHVRWNVACERPTSLSNLPAVVLGYLRQTIRPDSQAGWAEQGVSLHCYALTPSNPEPTLIGAGDRRRLVRGLMQASVRTKPEPAESLILNARECEARIAHGLRRPTDGELSMGIRHAVTPILCALITE